MKRTQVCFAIVSLAVLLMLGPSASSALEVPYLSQRVTDQADLLPVEAETRLEALLQTLEQETGAQVAVLTVPSLEGDVIEDFSLRVVEAWQLGREKEDDGVLLLVARDDRKVRIEVGYGFEGAITDLQSRRIIDGLIVPRFRQGDFAGGIEAAVDAIAGAVRGEVGAIPPEPQAPERDGGDSMFMFLLLTMFGWSALRTPGRGGWMLWIFLMPFFFFLGVAFAGPMAGLVALAAWAVIGAILRLILPKAQPSRNRSRGRGGVPWIGTGGGGFGGGFSGGGFSGGGGSFGGGGASGSW